MVGFFDIQINQNITSKAGGVSGLPENNIDDDAIDNARVVSEARTEKKIREAIQELLKFGLLEEATKSKMYRIALSNTEDITRILEPLDLDVGVDEIRGLLYIKVRLEQTEEQDEWTHPLVRRLRLNLEQSLLLAILRQHFVAWEQENGNGANQPQIAIEDLLPQLQIYLGDPGSESKERTRLISLIDQLKGHGVVTSPDVHEQITIRPIIVHLADPTNLQALLAWLQEQAAGQIPATDTSDKDLCEEEV